MDTDCSKAKEEKQRLAQLQLDEYKQQMGIDGASGSGTVNENENSAQNDAKESAEDEESIRSVNRSLEDEDEDWESELGENAKKRVDPMQTFPITPSPCLYFPAC